MVKKLKFLFQKYDFLKAKVIVTVLKHSPTFTEEEQGVVCLCLFP